MNTQEDKFEEKDQAEEVSAQELMPDRDVLMMEKPMPDNRAAGYKPADKKLLRNIVIVVLFLIAVLVVLWALVGKWGAPEAEKGGDTPTELEIGVPQ